jgi:hypothetical protein
MRFDPKQEIKDMDIIDMMKKIADQMMIEGKKEMRSTKLGITCYTKMTEEIINLKYSIDWRTIEAYLEEFARARVRKFYCWNMGIEMVIDIAQKYPILLYCDEREIVMNGKTPEFIGNLDETLKTWKFQRKEWT